MPGFEASPVEQAIKELLRAIKGDVDMIPVAIGQRGEVLMSPSVLFESNLARFLNPSPDGHIAPIPKLDFEEEHELPE